MSIMVWDVETTGLPDYKARSHDPRQPHIVSLAWVSFTPEGKEIGEHHVLVRPDGWRSSPQAELVHGITYERGMDEGIPEKQVTEQWVDEHVYADLRVAHNVHHDDRILKIAMLRYGWSREDIDAILAKPKFDTCRAATRVIKPGPSVAMAAKGMKMSRSVSLVECLKHFFDLAPDGAHDALWDARQCARLYWHLQTLEKPA